MEYFGLKLKNIALHGITYVGLDGKMYAMYYDADIGYYFVFKIFQYPSRNDMENRSRKPCGFKRCIMFKKNKKIALQTRQEELFTIDNLPETTPTPNKSQKE
ncbi:hypothetical protein GLOIN_2v1580400 [Rhizophagus clarus]|uniref:Uncharacterized protein n=1 Tax=Rhizophagus clarus TaxID=94130 RepID=A0A8H3L843_9GLOM|nr:hypothetical protein GLOIN_2v1580400 [Rhizophagus clarus]